MCKSILLRVTIPALALGSLFAGCRSPQVHRQEADKAAYGILDEKQTAVYGATQPFTIERPADTLRRRLMLDQHLQYSDPSSLSTKDIKPIKKWPDPDYLGTTNDVPDPSAPNWKGGVLRLGLFESLQVAARNNLTYQDRKEQVYTAALALELQRDQFRTQWSAVISSRAVYDLSGDGDSAGYAITPVVGADQQFMAGASLTTRLALDVARILVGDKGTSTGGGGDLSFVVPILRGAGREVFTENLTQAERNVVYALWEFEQFRRTFVVQIADSYLAVLQAADAEDNEEQSYRRLIISTSRSKRIGEAGRVKPFEVDQAIQDELRARDRWIRSRQSYSRQLDVFKVLIGLPPDVQMELDLQELRQLAQDTARTLGIEMPSQAEPASPFPTTQPTTQPATRPASQPATRPTTEPAIEPSTLDPPTTQNVQLREPSPFGGPYEIPEEKAIELALKNRPDLKTAQGNVLDAQRQIYLAANGLLPTLDLTLDGAFAERRSGFQAGNLPDGELRPDKGVYGLGVLTELPLERTREQNTYRLSLIALERAVRDLQDLEDIIKQAVRSRLRDLLQAREGLQTQATSVIVARRRVRGTDLNLQAGRASVRDVLDSQNSLITAQNALTAALVDYRIAELELQRDLGVLTVNHEGLWQEYKPPTTRPVP